MKVLGLIAEYNPFHYGHKYHLEKSLKETNSNYSIAIMSGSFVQRGEPSIVDKWTKAKMAIDNGVDLVIELPTLYSTQSAELFSQGAIEILNSIGIVDSISFGSEAGELEPLKIISKILIEEPKHFKEVLTYHLSLGNSFPVSRSLALESFIDKNFPFLEYDFKEILRNSNNILGIEYIKALEKTDSSIKAHTIKRIGGNYKDSNPNPKFTSATAIRNILYKGDVNLSKNLIPIESFNRLKDYLSRYGSFNSLENYNNIIRYLFLTKDKKILKRIFDIDEGLENRILKYIKRNNNLVDIISNISTRRYPITRIQRIFMHLLLDIYSSDVKNAYIKTPGYIRILGSNHKGFRLLNKIKKESSVKIITKFSDYKNYNIESVDTFLDFEKKVTDIFFLGLNLIKPLTDMDFYTSPYIKP